MDFEIMEKLAALDHKLNTAIHKLRINIGVGLMDVSAAIRDIELKMFEIQSQKKGQAPGQ